MSNAWENFPLPPHIEKKYDFNTKRFFYIDHMNKVTTWEDPRPKYYAQQQRMFNSSNQQPQYIQPSPQPQRSPQSHRTQPSGTNNVRSRAASSDIEETNIDLFDFDDGYAFEIATLQSKFPSVAKSEIKSVINKHNGSVEMASRELQAEADAANRKQEFENKVKVVSDSFPEFSKDSIAKLMKKHNLIVYKVRDELASIRSKRADAVRSLRMQYPDAKENIITDIFALSNHDLNEAAKKLKEMGFSRPSLANVSKSGQDRPSSAAPQSSLTVNSKPKPTSATSERSKSPTPSQPSTASNKQPVTVLNQTKAVSPAKQTVNAKIKEKSLSPKKKANQKQLSANQSKVKHRSHLAIGPNPDLHKGPDLSLLSSSECCLSRALGPDPSLRQGPQLERQRASRIAAVGPNPSLCRGPDVNLRCSSNPRLIVGSV